MNRRLWLSCSCAVLAAAGLAAWAEDAPAAKRELLSRHETVAQFQGIQSRTCLGLTAFCPDRCGHSGRFAAFRILAYTDYEKPGQYGDPKQGSFAFQTEDNLGNAKIAADLAAAVKALQPGDCVRLGWRHEYITRDGSSFPERPVTRIEKITKEEAEKLSGKPVPERVKQALPGEAAPVQRPRILPLTR